jgi:hypothetical protein
MMLLWLDCVICAAASIYLSWLSAAGTGLPLNGRHCVCIGRQPTCLFHVETVCWPLTPGAASACVLEASCCSFCSSVIQVRRQVQGCC